MKVMVVTGAGRGIGAAIATAAAAQGYSVAVNYRSDGAAAAALVERIARAGGTAVAVQADVARREQAQALFAQVDAALGPVDVLVNNAGVVGAVMPIEDVTAELLDGVFAANVFSCFYCIGEAVKRMSGRGGVIVNMSSAAARHGGMPNEAHYAASKGAIDSLTLALAKQLGERNIRINALRPGVIETGMHDVHGGAGLLSAVAPTIPLRRIGTPQEVADAVLWLASDASSYVHGGLIDVSGGR